MLQMHGHVLEITGLKRIGLLCSYDVQTLCRRLMHADGKYLKISLDECVRKGLYMHIRL